MYLIINTSIILIAKNTISKTYEKEIKILNNVISKLYNFVLKITIILKMNVMLCTKYIWIYIYMIYKNHEKHNVCHRFVQYIIIQYIKKKWHNHRNALMGETRNIPGRKFAKTGLKARSIWKAPGRPSFIKHHRNAFQNKNKNCK